MPARASVNLTAGAVSLKDVALKGVELGPLLVDYLCQPYAVTGPLEHQGNVAFSSSTPLTSLCRSQPTCAVWNLPS